IVYPADHPLGLSSISNMHNALQTPFLKSTYLIAIEVEVWEGQVTHRNNKGSILHQR
ncbi:hypothetical protein FRX31_013627, partial [Thalictrum thalictroides]